jgi:glycosyltransferase involved in cell wall biosynthesis
MTKIILCMIVKNESRIIQRVMESARPIIDAYSICDTGSSDNTREKIEEFAKTHNIPGDVHDVPWQNFGYNRSESFIRARLTATRLGFDHSQTYALFLDGDHILKVDKGFDKSVLNGVGYQIPQVEYNIRYYNTRFARLSNTWKCVGVTHEYWNMEDEGFFINKLENPWIEDKADGGCKSDKFERDIRLLEKGLEEDPKNVRYMFYLAQSYKDNNQPEQSIKWYTNRIEAGGWDEEVYYSMLQIGRIYYGQRNIEKTAFWYLKAHNFRPVRNESLVELAFAYKDQGQYTTALMFTNMALGIPFPANDVLFVNYKFYHETPRHLVLEIAPRCNKPVEAIESANTILLDKKSEGTARGDAIKILTSIAIKLNTNMDRFMDKNNKESLYTRVKVRGRNGSCMLDSSPASLKNFENHTTFSVSTASSNDFEKLKGFKLEEYERIGHIAIAKGLYEGKPCGAIIKFSMYDAIEKCDIVQSSKGAFMPFYHEGKLAVLQNLSPLNVLLLDANGAVTGNLTGDLPINIDDKFEMTSSIVEYNSKYCFIIRWVLDKICHQRFVMIDKSLKSMKVSMPFVISTNMDRITSFTIGQEFITLYLDSEDSESMVMKVPVDVLNQVFKNG